MKKIWIGLTLIILLVFVWFGVRLLMPDPILGEIKEILTNFELPEEGRITDDKRLEEMLYGIQSPEPEDIIAYENGFLIDKTTKEVVSIAWIDGNSPEPYGTQVLSNFKTLVKTELSEDFSISNEEKEEERVIDWGVVVYDIDNKISYITRLQDGLKEYPIIYSWLQEAKQHFLTAKEFGNQNTIEAYDEYKIGVQMFGELVEILE